MARGDATFARCNVDWIDDPRCEALPSNDARWLNHILWLLAVKARSEAIPVKYSVAWFKKKLGLTDARLQKCLRSMVDQPEPLVTITPEGILVVEGVQNQNSKLTFKPTPQTRGNPWVTDTGYVWGVMGNLRSRPLSDRERERDIEKEREKERAHARFGEFMEAYPRGDAPDRAEAVWLKLNPDEDLFKKILRALGWQVHSKAWVEDGGKFIPYPATYLKDKRWKDTQPKKPLTHWDLDRLEDKRLSDEIKRKKDARQRKATTDGLEPITVEDLVDSMKEGD